MDRYIAIVEGIEYGISMNPHSNNDKWYLWKSHILSTSGWLCVYLYTVWVYIYICIYTIRHICIYILWISNTFLLWCSFEATMCTTCELISADVSAVVSVGGTREVNTSWAIDVCRGRHLESFGCLDSDWAEAEWWKGVAAFHLRLGVDP